MPCTRLFLHRSLHIHTQPPLTFYVHISWWNLHQIGDIINTGGVKNMKMQKSNIANNLTALRRLNRLSQEDVADRIGVSRQAVAKWEAGHTQRQNYHEHD